MASDICRNNLGTSFSALADTSPILVAALHSAPAGHIFSASFQLQLTHHRFLLRYCIRHLPEIISALLFGFGRSLPILATALHPASAGNNSGTSFSASDNSCTSFSASADTSPILVTALHSVPAEHIFGCS